MATPPPEIAEYGPGIAGVVAGALMAIKEGWRPFLVHLAIGLLGFYALSGWIVVVLSAMAMPEDAARFTVGLFCVQVFRKLTDTIQQLEVARPINAMLERWTGAKTPTETNP